MQNFATIEAKFPDSKFVASTKSYARLTKPHFPPSERHFTGPTRPTFLPGKQAGSKLFGWILHIFFGKAPRFRRCPWIQDWSHLRPLNACGVKMPWPSGLLLSNANHKAKRFCSLCIKFKFGVWNCTKTRLLNSMASTISPSDASSVQNSIGRTPARVPRVP